MTLCLVPDEVKVVTSYWLDGDDGNPPVLELELSSGAFARIGFDLEMGCPLFWLAPNAVDSFMSARSGDSGVPPEVMLGLFGMVEAAAKGHDDALRAEYFDAYTNEEGSGLGY